MNSPKLGDKPRMQQAKLRQNRQSMQLDQSDDEIESSPSQILERVKSDRITVTKPEEDRRRRTIIIEKKNGTYGFTLQSYGIHYKKEQEIEMITYVDYVDYDGPAYRAGMREGDVILSINGNDMEKADHKTLVNFIKNCDSRMRMVVLFEDCVRKVELHIRYIQLQRFLQNKMEELEKLCLRERQLLEGKWKTHSLPARRKASTTNDNTATHQTNYSYSRPALSSEDIVNKPHPEQQPTLMLAYQYLDPHYRTYVLSPQVSNGGEEYMVNLCSQRSCRPVEKHHFVIKTPCDNSVCSNKASPQSNGLKSQNSIKKYEKKQDTGRHLCNPCVKTNNTNQDSTSLDAYDLASPCCDPHCVPSARRRSRNHKDHVKRVEQEDEIQNSYQPRSERKHKQHCHAAQSSKHRYLNLGAEIVSQCSLHSCTSSEFSNTQVAEVIESSGASYTTSLSTDTLYYDPPSGSFTSRSHGASSKSMAKSYHQHPQSYYPPENEEQYAQYNPTKPKSWDNLTTKAFGGYGFGYGFLDTSTKQHKRSQNNKANQTVQYPKHNNERHLEQQPIYSDRTFRRYVPPTKSTESLLTMPKFQTDSSISCECLDVTTPTASGCHSHFFRDNFPSPVEPRECYYTRRAPRIDSNDIIIVSTSSEVTRL